MRSADGRWLLNGALPTVGAIMAPELQILALQILALSVPGIAGAFLPPRTGNGIQLASNSFSACSSSTDTSCDTPRSAWVTP